MPAAGALVEMTAQRDGTTARNGPQHLDMLLTEPVAISFDESSSRVADEIGTSSGGRLIYSFNFSESKGLAVA
jgi:hypothetical protein